MKFQKIKQVPEHGEYDEMELEITLCNRALTDVTFVVTEEETVEIYQQTEGKRIKVMEFSFAQFYRLSPFLYNIELLFAFMETVSNRVEDMLIKIEETKRR